jgi:hypothetical protein
MPLLPESCFLLVCFHCTDIVHCEPTVVTFCCHGGSSDVWKYLFHVVACSVWLLVLLVPVLLEQMNTSVIDYSAANTELFAAEHIKGLLYV